MSSPEPARVPAPATPSVESHRAAEVAVRRDVGPAVPRGSGIVLPRGARIVPAPTAADRTSGRGVIIFAVVGLVLAAAMAGLYLYRRTSAVEPVTRGTPESAVQEFLGAVFLGGDAARVRAVVCGSWDPANAISRTTSMVEPQARVSWDSIRVVSADTRRANVTARLGLRLPDDVQPSVYQQWRFTVVAEDGWRVCEARPIE